MTRMVGITTGLPQGTDPVDVNPFPPGTLVHRVWAAATLEAEESICRLLQVPYLEGPEQFFRHIAAQFDIWAKRAVQVVWSHAFLRQFDLWLENYARAYLEHCKPTLTTVAGAAPGPEQEEAFRSDYRDVLNGRVRHWQAEGRRYLREQVLNQNGLTNTEYLAEQARDRAPTDGADAPTGHPKTVGRVDDGEARSAAIHGVDDGHQISVRSGASLDAPTGRSRFMFKRRPDGRWDIAYDSEPRTIKHTAGMLVIWELLGRPHTQVPSAVLLGKPIPDAHVDVEQIGENRVNTRRKVVTSPADDEDQDDSRDRGKRHRRYRRYRDCPEEADVEAETASRGRDELDAIMGPKGVRNAESELRRLKAEKDAIENDDRVLIAHEAGDHSHLREHADRYGTIVEQISRIEEHLQASKGLGGKMRFLNSELEKDRKAVQKRVRVTLKALRVMPALYDHLKRCIRTGGTSLYQPDTTNLHWEL